MLQTRTQNMYYLLLFTGLLLHARLTWNWASAAPPFIHVSSVYGFVCVSVRTAGCSEMPEERNKMFYLVDDDVILLSVKRMAISLQHAFSLLHPSLMVIN